jgi:hypothetical protein
MTLPRFAAFHTAEPACGTIFGSAGRSFPGQSAGKQKPAIAFSRKSDKIETAPREDGRQKAFRIPIGRRRQYGVARE